MKSIIKFLENRIAAHWGLWDEVSEELSKLLQDEMDDELHKDMIQERYNSMLMFKKRIQKDEGMKSFIEGLGK